MNLDVDPARDATGGEHVGLASPCGAAANHFLQRCANSPGVGFGNPVKEFGWIATALRNLLRALACQRAPSVNFSPLAVRLQVDNLDDSALGFKMAEQGAPRCIIPMG
jgi:hypothetical protein